MGEEIKGENKTKIINKTSELIFLREKLDKKKKIVFIPFLGGLHKGHIELIKSAKLIGDEIWCSIYLNEYQFQNVEDYKSYPIVESEDISILIENNVNVIYKPCKGEVYKKNTNEKFSAYVDFNNIEEVEGEGKIRVGFFRGIGTILCKFFNWIKPKYVIFGQKDFLQTIIVKNIIEQFFFSIQIIILPIVRDYDGLAFASRNNRLSIEDRENSTICYKILKYVQNLYLLGERNVNKLINSAKKFILDNNVCLNYLTINNWYTGYDVTEKYLFDIAKYVVCVGIRANDKCCLVDCIVLENKKREDIIKIDDIKCNLIFENAGLCLSLLQDKDVENAIILENDSFPIDEIIGIKSIQDRYEQAKDLFLGLYKLDEYNNKQELIGYINATCYMYEIEQNDQVRFPQESLNMHIKNGNIICIHSVVISEKYRLNGYAELMLKQYIIYIKNLKNYQNIRFILLLCHDYLIHFYQKCGFQLIQKWPGKFGNNIWYDMKLSIHDN